VRREARVPFEHGRLGQMVQTLERAFAGARTDRTDGLKLTLANGWVVVRASNTEPILRLTVEAREAAQADALLRQVVSLAR
jgi:phosphomannomutase